MMAVAILHQTEPSSCAACGFYRNGRNGNYEAIECQASSMAAGAGAHPPDSGDSGLYLQHGLNKPC